MPGPLIAYATAKALQPGTVTFAAFSAGLFMLADTEPVRLKPPVWAGSVLCGGKMKDWARSLYSSAAWKNIRGYVFHRDQMLCQDCLKKGIYTPAEEVHHIVELTPSNVSDPNIALNADNLISLCRECHRARHSTNSRRYTIDENGKVTIK